MKYTLWFDVEQRYKTILHPEKMAAIRLWFDVEQRYKTICHRRLREGCSCGLM